MKKILVCDDEESIRTLLHEALSPYYETELAADGIEALKKLDSNNYDLIIMDIKMPHMHGIEAIKKIREKRQNLPIIICSAYPKMAQDLDIMESEIHTFINKPIDLKALKSIVFECIGT